MQVPGDISCKFTVEVSDHPVPLAVLGTGVVGRTLSARWVELGHDVVIGARDPVATLARRGDESFASWAQRHPSVDILDHASAVSRAPMVVNATNGAASLAVLREVGPERLAGKVLIDVANPLDFSGGMPPTLSVKDTDSLGEQLQRALPDTRVVKTLNTVTADLMVHPDLLSEAGSLFVSGNDDDAKGAVTDLLTSMGHRDIIDVGDISTARGTEMVLALWVRLMTALGTSHFNFKVVR